MVRSDSILGCAMRYSLTFVISLEAEESKPGQAASPAMPLTDLPMDLSKELVQCTAEQQLT
jgi:hypothetical protein